MFRSSLRRLGVLLALALAAPAGALAQSPNTSMLDGDPLNVWASDDGSLQVSVDGFTVGEWYSPGPVTDPVTGNQGPNPIPSNGFAVVTFGAEGTVDRAWGKFVGSPFPNPEGPTRDGSSLRSAWTIPSESFDSTSAPLLRVEQVVNYGNGSRQVDATWVVRNVSNGPVHFRAGFGGDLAIRGSDSGVGFFQAGPPRWVGGLNQSVGAAGGFVEITPWSHYQVSRFSEVRSNLGGPGLNDQVETTEVDNGMGVQWDTHQPPNAPLAPGQSAEFRVGQRFVDTLGLDPVRATQQTGAEHVISVKVADINGRPEANARLRWQVDGVNPAEGAVTTNATGTARFGWIGGQPGDDVVSVYRDANGNGDPDFDETQAKATVTWEGPPPPIMGVSVNVRPAGGDVFIRLPRGRASTGAAKQLGVPVTTAATKFTKLRGAVQVPVGSIIDNTRGRKTGTLRLLSAGLQAANNSQFNGASFRGGQFQISQRGGSPLTTLNMRGALTGCRTRVPKGGARKIVSSARRRSRSIFGSGRGRFRTRGRNSSATVRGTQWVQKDTCGSTTTLVRQGSVTVRDFAKRRNVTLRAKGRKKYVARAPKRRR